MNEDGRAHPCRRPLRDNGLRFVHVSTDFVFDGTKGAPYVETDEPNPLSVYGASKLAGERAVAEAFPDALIVRTAWVYGPPGPNFPQKILERARAGGTLQVVDTEVGCPTYTRDLARGILGLLDADASGLYHLVGAGFVLALRDGAQDARVRGPRRAGRACRRLAVPDEGRASRRRTTRLHEGATPRRRAAAVGVVAARVRR